MVQTVTATNTLILGAGPAGLALGHELQRHRVPFLILEQGPGAGHSWQRMPAALRMVSPWRANHLNGFEPQRFPANHACTRDEFHRYLVEHARAHALPIEYSTRVLDVRRHPAGGFSVETARGPLLCQRLVNATGYFGNPLHPTFPGLQQSSLGHLHYADFVSGSDLRTRVPTRPPRALIVGQGLSAGQLLTELVEAGFDAALSLRSPIRFGAGPSAAQVFFRFLPELEGLKLLFGGPAARAFPARLPRWPAREWIGSGRVRVFPDIARFECDSVVFRDGCVWRPDVVLFATGFRPALDHLAGLNLPLDAGSGLPQLREFECIAAPDLFFLGIDHGRNFQSRFIRGLRRDAVLLGRRLSLGIGQVNAGGAQPAARAATTV